MTRADCPPASRERGIVMTGATVVPIRGENGTSGADITDLVITVTTIESRILRLVRDGARQIPPEDLTDELSILAQDLGRCYRRLADLRDRRDLSFTTQRKLHRLQEQCIWLYRKSQKERSFFKKLCLETRLRALISHDAFGVYQQLLNVDDEERRLAAHDDATLAACLLAEPETV
jgi:hypothetical protein